MSDYNLYAESMYGIDPIELTESSIASQSYQSNSVKIFKKIDEILITGEDALEVIAAASCVFRCVDNASSMIDQYGRIMQAYYLARSRKEDKEFRATTESGHLVFIQLFDNSISIRIV